MQLTATGRNSLLCRRYGLPLGEFRARLSDIEHTRKSDVNKSYGWQAVAKKDIFPVASFNLTANDCGISEIRFFCEKCKEKVYARLESFPECCSKSASRVCSFLSPSLGQPHSFSSTRRLCQTTISASLLA
jgi:hypothetical protein